MWDKLWGQSVDEHWATSQDIKNITAYALQHTDRDEIISNDVQRASKLFKDSTALGGDLWGPYWFKNMSVEVAQAWAHLLNRIEEVGTWPAHMFINIIVLMGKPPPGGVRPIALMPMIYRLRTKIRKEYIDEWEAANRGPWDAAVKGSSALRAVVLSMFHDEFATLSGEEVAKILGLKLGNIDLGKFSDGEIKVESQVELTHGLISLGKEKESSSMCTLAVEQSEKSKYSLHSIHHGWDYARFEPRIIQSEGEASTIIKGLQVTKSKEQIATHSLIRFEGPNGKLDQLQKAVASEYSHCIFNGSIEVPQKAQKTEAAQLSRNLLLSKRARIDTKPELEIVADDVRCTHGATVSQLQDEELFYLLSRGIDNKHANSLLLKGYYDEVISHFPKSAGKWNFIEKLIQDIKK